MDKELNAFKIEVLTQLAVINSKLDGYNKIQEVAREADNRSKQNKADIKDLQEKNKWLVRTIAAALITSLIGILFIYLKIGIGINK